MRLQIVQDALKKKNIKYEYTETDAYVAVCADQYGASDDNRTQRVVF